VTFYFILFGDVEVVMLQLSCEVSSRKDTCIREVPGRLGKTTGGSDEGSGSEIQGRTDKGRYTGGYESSSGRMKGNRGYYREREGRGGGGGGRAKTK
jgi:hypothetical protein